jgi:hypothetical protein
MTIFDLTDLVDVEPGKLAPYGTKQMVPGLFIPDPAVNELHPGMVNDSNVRFPLYASDIQVRQPGELGPYGYMQLGDNSGVWVPNPRMNEFRPGFYKPPAGEKPITIEEIKYLNPGEPGPRGYIPLGDSGVWIPGPDTAPKGVSHASNLVDDDPDGTHTDGTPNDIFQVDYQQLEGFARGHEQQSGQIAQWANVEQDFADQLLATHGKVAYATYLNVKNYNDNRHTEASTYAVRNDSTAVGLRDAIYSTQSTDENNAAVYGPTTTNT